MDTTNNLLDDKNFLSKMNLELFSHMIEIGSWDDRREAFSKVYDFHLSEDMNQVGTYLGHLIRKHIDEMCIDNANYSIDPVSLVYLEAARIAEDNLFELLKKNIHIEVYSNYLDTKFDVMPDDIAEKIIQTIKEEKLEFNQFKGNLNKTTLAVFDEIGLDLDEMKKCIQ